MFRQMRRVKQLLPDETAAAILEKNTCGVLSLLGDDGYPYGVPISYVYKEDSIYFHSAKTGHKIDAIKNMTIMKMTIEHMTAKEALDLINMKK